MDIWVLETIHCAIRYDTAEGHVVVAETEEEARRIAADNCGDEGRQEWLSEERSTCVKVDTRSGSRLILRSFNAG